MIKRRRQRRKASTKQKISRTLKAKKGKRAVAGTLLTAGALGATGVFYLKNKQAKPEIEKSISSESDIPNATVKVEKNLGQNIQVFLNRKKSEKRSKETPKRKRPSLPKDKEGNVVSSARTKGHRRDLTINK